LARGDEEKREERPDLQAGRGSAADRRARQARCVQLEDLLRAGVEEPAVQDRGGVVAEPNRGGGLVERDDGARELAQLGVSSAKTPPALVVALLEEGDLALLELSDLRPVRIETEENVDRSGRLGSGCR
jgi:hypothetical protein